MMEPNSFTSEPQYQRPDQRNSFIYYIRNPEPIVIQAPTIQAPVPVQIPIPVQVTLVKKLVYYVSFGKRFISKFGSEV